MNYATFFIQQQSITAYVVKIESQIKTVLFEHTISSESDLINITLSQIIEKMTMMTKNSASKTIYRVILTSEMAMQRDVQLPRVSLNSYELEQYIKNLLPKIFHTQNQLAYDYIVYSEDNAITSANNQISQHKNIKVYAYEQKHLDNYIKALNKSNIDFIGLTDGAEQQSDNDIMNSLAALPILSGINFLPWREKLNQRKRTLLFIVVTNYLLLFSIIFIFQFYQIANRHQNVVNQNDQLQSEQVDKSQQLLVVTRLNKQVQQLQSEVNKNLSIQKQFTIILDYLILLSAIVPDGLWLNSLEYKDNNINLIGKSFLYSDILAFSELQNDYPIIQNNQITVISKQGYLLQFKNHIQLTDNIYREANK